ncbi:MAG: HsdR family type I site-specific deoxyribonuclease, partial [Candidatus Absconditabacterales bacterium]|nr:HsdR family type I site-specific deoxyribonuclease [Candidatus Absconditabacterales bacterium]
IKVREELGENKQTVWLIDWKHPRNNHFAFAEEVTVTGKHNKRPDIVLYVNGIALGVLELKRSTISVSEGIRQNLDNQKKEFIQHFFSTIQLVMAGNDTQGIRYGTIETPEKYYLEWKEQSEITHPLHRHLVQLCEPTRFLELIHDFVIFDAGIKKLCRHNQYFGVKASQECLKKREGGIIRHTQGSGKSLTMVWLAKWIRENIDNSRVLIITDREELDEQIEKVFTGVQEEIYRTKSGNDLIAQLAQATPWFICSLIHKFGAQGGDGDDTFIKEMQSVAQDFVVQGDIYVFVDECHRTQSGKLHDAMKKILPNAVFIGFTGTPLLKKDKPKSIEVFGRYIHTYKFDEAVKDKVVLDLRYEARDIDQKISSQDKIDQWFEAKTRGLTEKAKEQLKQKRGTMQTVLSSQSRLEKIVSDILLDMETKDRLKSGRGNAMLVAGSIYEACKYYELFQKSGFEKCAIITSYNPSIGSIKGETTGDNDQTENTYKYKIYEQMLGGKSVEEFEKETKKKFIEEPGQMKLLIVVDKLLTGFDAPPATYLYIDKSMRDHGLFQAICRVNRLDGEDKEYGYIIDYRDLFGKVENAVADYTSGAFDGYDDEDVKGLLSDRLEKAKERLEMARETIKALCEAVPQPKDTVAYIHYFCGDSNNPDELGENAKKRDLLYKSTVSLIRSFANIVNEMQDVGYSKDDIETIRKEVEYYMNVRDEIKIASGDYIDLKAYEPAMRHLIDTYISAEESKVMATFDDKTILQIVVDKGIDFVNDLPKGITSQKDALAETIENNLRRLIIDEQAVNPKYYEKMSILLDELIKDRESRSLAYEEYLKKMINLTKEVKEPQHTSSYPSSLNTSAKRALYDNLGQDEKLALDLDDAIQRGKKADWRGHLIKEREVQNIIKKFISNPEKAKEIFELVKNQRDY